MGNPFEFSWEVDTTTELVMGGMGRVTGVGPRSRSADHSDRVTVRVNNARGRVSSLSKTLVTKGGPTDYISQ